NVLARRELHDGEEEPVLVVPEVNAGASHVRHGVSDVQKVFEVLGGHVLVEGVVPGKLEGYGQHRDGEAGHPARAVALYKLAAAGERLVAVEHADVIHAEEATAEDVSAGRVLAVEPEAKGEHLVLKQLLQEVQDAISIQILLY